MATNYFNKFPRVRYDVSNDGSLSVLTDITKTVDITTADEDNIAYYTYYEIQDGERPDAISYKLYGTVQYYWTLFVINDSLKAGLNNAWPLNSHAFEQMIAKEYDRYSAITFDLVLHNSLNENNILTPFDAQQAFSDFSVVPLVPIDNLMIPDDDQDEYLPYLRLMPSNVGADPPMAKILKYDNTTSQLVIYDIKSADGLTNVSRNSFIQNGNSLEFKLRWVNPYNATTETAKYNENEALKKRWVAAAVAFFEPIDQYYYPGRSVTDDGETPPSYNPGQEEEYIFNKKYIKVEDDVSGPYSWELYRNATQQYILTTPSLDNITPASTNSISIYDLLYNKNIQGTVQRISFYENEEMANSDKRNIKVIRPDKIREFSKNYFELLNS
jgi:hypothetical protein